MPQNSRLEDSSIIVDISPKLEDRLKYSDRDKYVDCLIATLTESDFNFPVTAVQKSEINELLAKLVYMRFFYQIKTKITFIYASEMCYVDNGFYEVDYTIYQRALDRFVSFLNMKLDSMCACCERMRAEFKKTSGCAEESVDYIFLNLFKGVITNKELEKINPSMCDFFRKYPYKTFHYYRCSTTHSPEIDNDGNLIF